MKSLRLILSTEHGQQNTHHFYPTSYRFKNESFQFLVHDHKPSRKIKYRNELDTRKGKREVKILETVEDNVRILAADHRRRVGVVWWHSS